MTCQLSRPLETAQDRAIRRGTSARIVNGSEAVGSLLHSYASKCAGRETKARYYMPYEQPLGDGSPAEGLPSLAPSKEAPSLPTRAPSYEAKRCAPKAQDRCASKRHPSTQRSVCQLCKARLRIVISSEARNLCHSRSSGQCLEIPNGKPAIHLPSGIAYIYCSEAATTTLNPEP